MSFLWIIVLASNSGPSSPGTEGHHRKVSYRNALKLVQYWFPFIRNVKQNKTQATKKKLLKQFFFFSFKIKPLKLQTPNTESQNSVKNTLSSQEKVFRCSKRAVGWIPSVQTPIRNVTKASLSLLGHLFGVGKKNVRSKYKTHVRGCVAHCSSPLERFSLWQIWRKIHNIYV